MTEGLGKSRNKQLILSERPGFQYTVGTIRPGNRERADTSKPVLGQPKPRVSAPPADYTLGTSLWQRGRIKAHSQYKHLTLNLSERFCLGSVSTGANSVPGTVLTVFMLYLT